MTDIACREADGINLPLGNIEQIRRRIPIIIENLKKYNRDPSDFEISLFTSIAMVSDQEELENLRRKKRILKRNLRNQFIGTPEEVKRKIFEVEEMGVDKMVISVDKTKIEKPLEVLCKELM